MTYHVLLDNWNSRYVVFYILYICYDDPFYTIWKSKSLKVLVKKLMIPWFN